MVLMMMVWLASLSLTAALFTRLVPATATLPISAGRPDPRL